MRALYPYETLFGDVTLSIQSLSVDGQVVPVQVTDTDRRRVFLSSLERSDWEAAQVEVIVRGPGTELAGRAEEWAPVEAVVTVNGRGTYANMRACVPLTARRAEEGAWEGSVELNRADWYGRADLSAAIIAKVEEVSHRIVGVADPWVVDFDDLPPSPVGGSIPVTWERFGSPHEGLEFLRENAEEPFYLKIESGSPHLYLNQDFDGLYRVLCDRGRRPPADQALHDHMRASIAVDVHAALFHAAMQAVELDEDGRADPPPEDWQRAVLDALLPRMYENLGSDEALQEAASDATTQEAAGSLQERMLPAVLDHAQYGRLVRRGLSVLERSSPEREGESV